jgi:hypothetical protein
MTFCDGLSRRDALRASLAALFAGGCSGIGSLSAESSIKPLKGAIAHDINRAGPDLNVISDGRGVHRGTWLDHIVRGHGGGLDFGVDVVYPLAEGVVASVAQKPGAGKHIEIYHGLYVTNYLHLAETNVRRGQRVKRSTRIGYAGQTGTGASYGPHLHISVIVFGESATSFIKAKGQQLNGVVWFDPVDFAAFRGIKDRNGSLTLPYWSGETVDGRLDYLWNNHYVELSHYTDYVLSKVGTSSQIAAFAERRRLSRIGNLGERMRLLSEAIRRARDGLNGGSAGLTKAESLDLITGFDDRLSVGPMLTAPFRNPSPHFDSLYV